ncbi:MAG: sigma-70 family RNA polymerase sigma factor [Myxococcales bacterium]|nr:sigma-70 family RNA polymerase sigma factor [Myxococcales bacterium]
MISSPIHLDELLALHGDRLYGLCARLDPDPGDAYGAVCERLLHALPRFDPARGSPRAWAMTVAHRVLVDRHRRRRPVQPLSGTERAPEQDAAQHVALRRRRDRLEAALQVLDEAQRRVVVLHHLDGVPLARIAEVEGVAVGTVKSRLHRGRAHLAVLLQEDR